MSGNQRYNARASRLPDFSPAISRFFRLTEQFPIRVPSVTLETSVTTPVQAGSLPFRPP
ncbi:hypothetical protein [Paenibacillus sp. N3.4]|uniref:hypothetical protein n=1 Tax=Paenibacillus sp. N3.4 TaxID=2603222 RepID=UPI00164FC9A3|nr:hypothetical protein [Paenibacillus sp. N3.4]